MKKNLNELNQLSDFVSPMSWLYICAVAGIPLVYFLFQPSLTELAIFLVVELSTVPFHVKFAAEIFVKLFPASRPFFFEVKEKEIQSYPPEKKVELLECMFATPQRAAVWSVIYSFFKTFPGMAVVVFVWQHHQSNWNQFLMILGLALINTAHFYGVVATETHQKLSEIIKNLHEKYDWTTVFERAHVPYSRRDFALQERVPAVLVFAFTILTEVSVIMNQRPGTSTIALTGKVVLVSLAGMLLHARNRYLVRNLFVHGLEDIFDNMQGLSARRANFFLPLPTFPLLARFGQSFNDLLRRVRLSERELSALVVHKSEESRYQALGEFTALIAHDLSNPLHTIQFLVQELSEDPEKFVRDDKGIRHLKSNVESSVAFVSSLRSRLRNSESSAATASVHEAYLNAIRPHERSLLRQKVNVDFSDDLIFTHVQLSRVDLIHIFHNLFSNTLKNFADHGLLNPQVRIWSEAQRNPRRITIFFSDNGTGLSQERFEEATGFRFLTEHTGGTGLGLRLVRRLLEQNGGSLTLVPWATHSMGGTTFAIDLERAEGPPPPTPRPHATAERSTYAQV